jgi:hypothetical protein
MKKIGKIILFGILVWLIPFIVSFFFVNQDGTFRIEETFFKTIMIVVGSLVGVKLMVCYFKKIDKNYLKEGILIGLVWLAINWIIDLIFVFAEFFPMTVGEYFTDIGFRYLVIPIFSIGMGYILNWKLTKNTNK